MPPGTRMHLIQPSDTTGLLKPGPTAGRPAGDRQFLSSMYRVVLDYNYPGHMSSPDVFIIGPPKNIWKFSSYY